MNKTNSILKRCAIGLTSLAFLSQFFLVNAKTNQSIFAEIGGDWQKGTTTTTHRSNGVITDQKVETFCLPEGDDNCTPGCQVRFYTNGIPGDWEDCDTPPPEE